MRRTSYVRRRSRMHQFDLVVTECVGCCKFFISNNYRISYTHTNANAAAGTLDGAILL